MIYYDGLIWIHWILQIQNLWKLIDQSSTYIKYYSIFYVDQIKKN